MKRSVFHLTVLLGAFLFANSALSQQLPEEWVARYNSPSNSTDNATALTVDGNGGVYVTGIAGTNTVTIKYDASGNLIWEASVSAAGYPPPNSIVVDGLGNVYVGGIARVVKSDSNGAQLCSGPVGYSIALGSSGDFYVADGPTTATPIGGVYKLDSNCNILWSNNNIFARDLVLDSSENVYATGYSGSSATGGEIKTVKFSSNGAVIWEALYDGPQQAFDEGRAIVLDAAGNVYVTGTSYAGGVTEFATIKYDPNGNQQWVKRYRGPLLVNAAPVGIAEDGAGGVFVAGTDGFDYATIKYDTNGNQIWVARYNGPAASQEEATALALDSLGNVYVTGMSNGGGSSGDDYATIKYDTNGNLIWFARYDGPANSVDKSNAIAVDASGNIYVTGQSYGNGTFYDYATIKYVQGPYADMSITKTDSPDPVTAGENLTYSITVTNNGPDTATGVMITDTLPGSVTLISATPSQGTCSGTITVTCDLGTLANGSSAIVTIVVMTTPTGGISNTAGVSSDQIDLYLSSNTATAGTSVIAPDLIMTNITPNIGTVRAGTAAPVTDTVENQGGMSAGAFNIGYVLSTNQIYGDSDDIAIATARSVSSLAAGASDTASTNLPISMTTPPGSYYVCAKADSADSVGESDENNNTFCSYSQINVIANSVLPLGKIFYSVSANTTPRTRDYTISTNTFSAAATTVAGGTAIRSVLRSSPTQNEWVSAYVSSSGVLQVMCYNGTTWSNEWSVTVGGTGTTRRFDIAYETNSGDVMVLYSGNVATTNELRYRTKPGSTGCGSANWSAATNLNPARTSRTVHWVKMAWDRRSSSNLITAIWADSASDLSAMVWSGTAWGNEPSAALTTTLQVVSSAQDVEDFDVEYESLTGDVMVIWATNSSAGANGVRYRTCNGGTAACTWSGTLTPPTWLDDATHLDLAAHPNTDEMVFASIGRLQADLQVGYWSGSAWTNTANLDTTATTPTAGTRFVAAGWLINGSTTRSVVTYYDSAATNIGWYVGNGGAFTLQTDFTPTPALATQRQYQIEVDPINKDHLMFAISNSASDIFAKRLVMSSTGTFTWTNADGGAALEVNTASTTHKTFDFAYDR